MTRRELLRDGEPVMFSPKGFELLALLVENHDRVMTKDELIAAVWRDAFVSEDSLSQLIFMLRRSLGDDPGTPRFIATSHRRGYRFIAEVTDVVPRAGEPSPPPAAIEPAVPPAVPPAIAGPTGIAASPASATRPPSATPARWQWLVVPVLILLAAGASWFAARAMPRGNDAPAAVPIRAVQTAPPGTTITSGGAISPDSRFLAFVARDERSGSSALWLRELGSGETREVPDTSGAEEPFWSPDSQRIAFASNGRLRVVDLQGAPARTLVPAGLGMRPGGGSWSTTGTILFAPRRSGLQAVSAAGGPVTTVTMLDAGARESAHRLPRFLPDGRHFLYYIVSAETDRSGTYIASIEGGDHVRLVDGAQATYAAGYLVYLRDSVLLAQRFDPDRQQFIGEPVTLAKDVSEGRAVAATNGNLIAFGESASSNNLVWFSRSGVRRDQVDSPAPLGTPMLTRDGTQVIGANNDQRGEHQGLWVADLGRHVFTRLTSFGMTPVPAPDNSQIVFASDQAGGIRDLYVLDREGGSEQSLLKTGENKLPTDWTSDGRYVVYVSTNLKTKQDLWVLPMFGERKPVPFLATPFNEFQARVSPDGKWIAYASDETGRWEVYLQSFPVAGSKQVVSVGGGGQPQWRGDGKELFFLALDRTMMSVAVSPGSPLQIAPPNPLFQTSVAGVVDVRNRYAPDANGQNFLVSTVDTTERPDIVLLINSLAP